MSSSQSPVVCQTLTVPEVATYIGVSRSTAYELVRTGRIPSVRIGRRIVVLPAVLDRWLVAEHERGRGDKLRLA